MTDKLTPVRCGCGGEAQVRDYSRFGGAFILVECERCGTQTDLYPTEAEAIQAWNRAMGAKDINVPNKFATDTNVGDKERTAKVETGHKSVITGKLMDGHCMQCGRYVMDEDDYCPGCGARLEWK